MRRRILVLSCLWLVPGCAARVPEAELYVPTGQHASVPISGSAVWVEASAEAPADARRGPKVPFAD